MEEQLMTTYAVTIDKSSLAEGNSGNTLVAFTITRSGNASGATSVDYTLDGTASRTSDYSINVIDTGITSLGFGSAITGTVNFAANETTKTIKINVAGDVLVEPDETIQLTLFNPSATTPASSITTAKATTTIQNDDGLNQVPTITSATYNDDLRKLDVIGNGFLALADNSNDIDVSKLSISGEGNKSYTLTSSNIEITSATSFTVKLNAADVTALAPILNNNGNYSITGVKYNLAAAEDWAAGAEPSLVVADLANNGIKALLGLSGLGYGVIIDPAATTEGNSGTKDLVFTVTPARPDFNNNNIGILSYTTVDGTAVAGTDYEATSGTFSFAGGELSKTIVVKIKGDTDFESNESFTLKITTNNYGNVVSVATGNIINDDDQPTPPAKIPTITSATFDTFTSTLVVTGNGFLALAGANNDINVSKLSFTGESGKSYTFTSNDVEITSDTNFSVVLSIADDTEVDKLINKDGTISNGGTTYNLAAAEGWAVGADPALKVADLTNVVTVSTNSTPISINSVSTIEGNNGTKDLVFTVTGFANNTGIGTADVGSVDYTTVNGTAIAGSDYVATSGTLNFLPGEVNKSITVKVNDDNDFEPDETFTIKLSNSIGNVIANDTGIGTITNDDAQVSGNSNTLRFTKISHLAQNRNELGVFVIDDPQGTVNNIAPGQPNYLTEVLKRSQVVFSALGESAIDLQLDNQASRNIDLPIGKQFGYYLVQNGSTSDLNAGAKPAVFFAYPSNDSGLANAKFTQNGTVSQLAFDDTSGGDKDFDDLVVQIENATTPTPLGTAQQGNKNIFDLTAVVNTDQVQTTFEIKRDASFNNHVGFYKIEDAQGSILVGTTLIKPGEDGYRQAIAQGQIAGIDLVGTNGQTTSSNGSFQGGALYAPFLIANASAANADFSNIYTAYSLGNADKVEHIRLLGDNTFGFEDLFGGGDRDYNDVIIKATFSSVPGNPNVLSG